jgi:hypothetical protein
MSIPSATYTYTGSGEALVLNAKCNKLIPFTSSYTWSYGGNGSNSSLFKINYENSIIGKRTFCAVFEELHPQENGFDGCLNYMTNYFSIDEDISIIYVDIFGKYKSCNYASKEIDYFFTTSLSASTKEALKKKSGSIEQLHKLLDEKPALKKRYLEIMAKLGK